MTSDWSKYRDIVVCALALYHRLFNVPKDLSNEFADAASKLCDKLEGVNDDKDEEDIYHMMRKSPLLCRGMPLMCRCPRLWE